MKKFNSNVDIAFKEFKNQSKCCVCGHNQATSNLHFHHINPKHKISDIGVFLADRDYYGTIAELTKCTILCANCHATYHSSDATIKRLIEEKFVKINIDDLVSLCNQYGAFDGDDNAKIDVDLIKRIIILEEKIKTFEQLLRIPNIQGQQTKIEVSTKKVKISIPANCTIDENIVVATFTETKSLNKTCEAAFGKNKKGAYYINKVKPILYKYGLID